MASGGLGVSRQQAVSPFRNGSEYDTNVVPRSAYLPGGAPRPWTGRASPPR